MGTQAGSREALAGFWRRGGALLIDVLAIEIIGSLVGTVWMWPIIALAGPTHYEFVVLGFIWWIVFPPAYFLYFWVRLRSMTWLPGSGNGQTIGHRLLGLRVVTVQGSPLGLGRAIFRYVGYWIGVLACGLGFLWVAFDSNKQGWHDKMAGTLVVRQS
jgi:uncharacterized RDD family membrane protein YckC